MKTTKVLVLALSLSNLAALPLLAGQGVGVQINVPLPSVTVTTPAVVVQAVPDSYVWDGTEYVGVVGTQYYYLGPNHLWLTLDGPRLVRFHDWEHGHADWRTHATRNVRYRSDAHGRHVPFSDHDPRVQDNRDGRSMQDGHAIDHGHDKDHR